MESKIKTLETEKLDLHRQIMNLNVSENQLSNAKSANKQLEAKYTAEV